MKTFKEIKENINCVNNQIQVLGEKDYYLYGYIDALEWVIENGGVMNGKK